MNIREAVDFFSEKLKNTDSPVREAKLIVGSVCKISMADIITKGDTKLSPPQIAAVSEAVSRRAAGEPFAYIVGEKEFMGMTFKVNKNVLIPRPDTEILVNTALENAFESRCDKILDLCTGSGCVAVSLAKFVPWAKVTAVDISTPAINIAKENAKKNDVSVNFIKKDLLAGRIKFAEKYKLVAANPPYIESKTIETLMPDVKDYEPMLALDGGTDGLEFYRKFAEDAEYFLEPGGTICLEIGYNQAESVSKILGEKFENITVIADYAGENRVVSAKLRHGTGPKNKLPEHSHNGHRERFKMRYRKEGIDAFSPHEVLELILFYAIPRKDVNEVAHKLINTFGSISAVLDASVDNLVRYGGLSENAALLLHMMPDVFRVYQKDQWIEKPALTNAYVAGKYACDLLIGAKSEQSYVICVDNSKAVLHFEKMSEGTQTQVAVYPRTVAEIAMKHKASGIFIVHNHPSGSLQPSWEDMVVTKDIHETLGRLGIIVIDHIIVAEDRFISMRQMDVFPDEIKDY